MKRLFKTTVNRVRSRWVGIVATSFVIAAVVVIVLAFITPLWFKDHGNAVQAAFVAALVGITAVYAWQTKKQADASVKMADTMLCPVLEQYIGETPLDDQDGKVKIMVKYKNVGNGPALDIRWSPLSIDIRRLDDPRKRVSMGIYEKEGHVDFELDVSTAKNGLRVAAEYASVLSPVWRSTLELQVGKTADGKTCLENKELQVEKIGCRTI